MDAGAASVIVAAPNERVPVVILSEAKDPSCFLAGGADVAREPAHCNRRLVNAQ
jgi:hypothetical protein